MQVLTIFSRPEHMAEMAEYGALVHEQEHKAVRVAELKWAESWMSDIYEAYHLKFLKFDFQINKN